MRNRNKVAKMKVALLQGWRKLGKKSQCCKIKVVMLREKYVMLGEFNWNVPWEKYNTMHCSRNVTRIKVAKVSDHVTRWSVTMLPEKKDVMQQEYNDNPKKKKSLQLPKNYTTFFLWLDINPNVRR